MTPETPDTKKPEAPGKARHRSPNYPGISLKVAIEKISGWYKADGVVATPREAALKHMGFEKFTSEAGRMLSALKSFGLAAEADGRIKLTPRGVDIVARPPDDLKRQQALREAGQAPAIYKALLKEYPLPLPSDTTLQSELIATKGFNPKSVKDFLKDFRASLESAGITNDTVLDLSKEGDSGDDENSSVHEGDYVQWESQGILQFPVPRKVTGFSDDREWAFLEGSTTGVLVSELTVVEAPTPATEKLPYQPGEKLKNVLKQPPPNPHFTALPPPANTRQDVFSIGEGTVTVQWPASLSPESFEDISAWLDILKRKIGRAVTPKEESTQ